MNRPFIMAVSGVKNSGKTTLICSLIKKLSPKGYTVATIKHDGHTFEADTPGTDTFCHFSAGAVGTAIFDGEKFLMVQRANVDEKQLIKIFPNVDFILLEGFKNSNYPKVELVRKGNSHTTVCDPATLLAVVSDFNIEVGDIPTIGFEDTDALVCIMEEKLAEVNS